MPVCGGGYSFGDNFHIQLDQCLLKVHKTNDCPSHQFTCQYCNYAATYMNTEVTTKYWPLCEKYLLPCLNDCGGDLFERQDLEKHLDEVCPLQMVECEVSYSGYYQYQHMQDHMGENVSMVSSYSSGRKS